MLLHSSGEGVLCPPFQFSPLAVISWSELQRPRGQVRRWFHCRAASWGHLLGGPGVPQQVSDIWYLWSMGARAIIPVTPN